MHRIRVYSDPFKWDGSSLGKHDSHIIVAKRDYDNKHYWKLSIDCHQAYCIARMSRDRLPCLIDELKPVFSLPKLGTHSISIQGKKYVITKAEVEGSQPLEELTLDELCKSDRFEMTESLRKQVCQVLAFREIFSITGTYESGIVMRMTGKGYYPVSFRECSTQMGNDLSVISNRLMEKWFRDDSMSQVLCDLLGVNEGTDLSIVLWHQRQIVEAIIRRIDDEYLWLLTTLQDRLSQRLDIGKREPEPEA